MKIINNININKGYAILFTVVVVGIISLISIGLSNSALKQLQLSSVAKDSTIAFYQADIGLECILYAENNNMINGNTGGTISCGENELTYAIPSMLVIGTSTEYTYTIINNNSTSGNKCFNAKVIKTESDTAIKTTVKSYGYNICDKTKARTVERAIEISY